MTGRTDGADESSVEDAEGTPSGPGDADPDRTAEGAEVQLQTSSAGTSAQEVVGVRVPSEPAEPSASPDRGAAPDVTAALTPETPHHERVLRFGWPVGALAVNSILYLPLAALLALPFFALGWFPSDATPPVWTPFAVLAPGAVLTWLFAGSIARRARNVASGTRGRARVLILAGSSSVRAIGTVAVAGILSTALTATDALALGYADDDIAIGTLPIFWESLRSAIQREGLFVPLVAALVVERLAWLLERPASLACWFLLPHRTRARAWAVIDAALILGFVAVTLLLPLRPPEGVPDAATLPAIRLAVTTLFAARLTLRMIPVILDTIESAGVKHPRWWTGPVLTVGLGGVGAAVAAVAGFEWGALAYACIGALALGLLGLARLGGPRALLAARLMRAKKSGFLTAIGLLSILAVSFSSCTLTTTLSVMGGFRNDLKRKILGNNAHVVVDQAHGTFEGWEPTLAAVRDTPGVVAATPYVQGEVMITSATNLGGAVIRGIDPETIGDVTDLPRNLRHGQLEYLSDPEQLLRLGREEMGRGLLAPAPSQPSGDDGSIFDFAAQTLDEADLELTPSNSGPAPASPEDAETQRVREEIDEFLLPEEAESQAEPTPDASDEEERPEGFGPSTGGDVLPGLIVGQELARTLRLHVGDEVNVVSPLGDLGPSGPMPRTRPFRIAGIFYSGMYEFDMKMAYATLPAAQRFLNVGDAVTGIEAKVDDTDNAEPIARAIDAAIVRPELRVRAWQEVNRNLFGALQLEKLAMFITLGIAILVASFCIVGTLTLMVQEKGKEVGILKAMGATNAQIVAIFMAQGLMIGLLGALMGLGLGYVACFAAEHFGIHLNPEVYYIDRLPVHIEPSEFVMTGIASVLVCLLATIYPAILGSRLRPVDALRYS